MTERSAGQRGVVRKVVLVCALLLTVAALPVVVDWWNEDEATASGAGYSWMFERDDGGPVRFDPCTPIHVEINQRTQVDDGDRMIRESLDSVAAASGLRFVVDGHTDEKPTFDVDEKDSGEPVVIAWSDPREIDDLEGDTTGVGGGVAEGDWYVGGTVALDGPEIEGVLEDKGWAEARAVVMHEIAHVIGLDHVDDPRELMHPEAQPGMTDWGPGDLAGLEILGSGGCRGDAA